MFQYTEINSSRIRNIKTERSKQLYHNNTLPLFSPFAETRSVDPRMMLCGTDTLNRRVCYGEMWCETILAKNLCYFAQKLRTTGNIYDGANPVITRVKVSQDNSSTKTAYSLMNLNFST